MIVYGLNPVLEALRAGRVKRLRVSDPTSERLSILVREAAQEGIPVRQATDAQLEAAARGGRHQGVVAELRSAANADIESLLTETRTAPLLVVLDGIEDPQNLGAILRTVDAAGAGGVVRQVRHAAPLGGATASASAGAMAHVRIAHVVNIAQALVTLKNAGVWTVGLAADASTRYDEVDFTLPTALVAGGEGTGLRRLVRERCDRLVCIPMLGHVESLNVSVATAVVLFEAVRQRRLASSQAVEGVASPQGQGRPVGG